MTTRAEIVAEARTWLDVRYRHQGRTRTGGIDCIGLPIKVTHSCYGWTFDTTDYERHATDETMLNLCRQHLIEIKKTELRPGDMVVMRFEHQRHAGMIGDYPHPGELSLIHAYAIQRRVVEQRLDSVWLSRVIGAFSFPGAI